MKKKIAFSLFLINSVFIQAQFTFMKMFDATGTFQQNLIELSSGNLRVGMAQQSGTSLISSQGDIIQSKNYVVDAFLVLQSIAKMNDNSIYFVGAYREDTCSSTGNLRMHPALGRMDSLGVVQWLSQYRPTSNYCSRVLNDLLVTSSHDIVTWSNLILKIDSVGDVAWSKHFENGVAVRFVKELPGGDLLAGLNLEGSGAVIARLTAGGDVLWSKSYFRPLGSIHDAVIEDDDNILVTGFTELATTSPFEPYPQSFHPKLFTLKVSDDGVVQWCRGYSTAPFHWYTTNPSRIVKAVDGNFAVLANIGVPTQNFHYRPLLMKLNHNGDTLWTRSSGHVNYPYETGSLLAYSDGGFIFNGRIWGTMPDGSNTNWAYLYKTDSLGHLPCFEVHFPTVISELFPVDSSFTLTSYDGATRHPAFITDTIYDPIVVYDACTFTTNLPPQAPRSRRPMSVRPNPNTGHFTLSFPDPLMAESYYSVYDTMGKLLFQRPLPHGKQTEEVDLTRFGAGTYVVRFTSKEGSCYERVVVE